MNLYGVRTGDWVEIRESEKTLRKVKQRLPVTTKKRTRYYDPKDGKYHYKVIKTVESIIFLGGRVVGLISFFSYVRITKTYNANNTCFKINKEFEKEVLKKFI